MPTERPTGQGIVPDNNQERHEASHMSELGRRSSPSQAKHNCSLSQYGHCKYPVRDAEPKDPTKVSLMTHRNWGIINAYSFKLLFYCNFPPALDNQYAAFCIVCSVCMMETYIKKHTHTYTHIQNDCRIPTCDGSEFSFSFFHSQHSFYFLPYIPLDIVFHCDGGSLQSSPMEYEQTIVTELNLRGKGHMFYSIYLGEALLIFLTAIENFFYEFA